MLNVSKTKIILIGTHQRLNAVVSFSVAADTTSLERMDTLKYLGVTMDELCPGKNTLTSLLGEKISSRLVLTALPSESLT